MTYFLLAAAQVTHSAGVYLTNFGINVALKSVNQSHKGEPIQLCHPYIIQFSWFLIKCMLFNL